MKFGVPWSIKGIRPEARETARQAARRSGMSLGEWLNSVILQQAAEDGVHGVHDDDDDDDELATVHHRLDDLTRRIERFTRSAPAVGPEAYAPKRSRDENEQIADLISRLDRRLDQFANTSRALTPRPTAMPAMPSAPSLPPSLDRAVAEIAARQRALNAQQSLDQPGPAQQRQQAHPQTPVAAPIPMPPLAPVLVPAPMQDISGLEDQLRRITDQIETLRKPGVEEAINALRDELGEIGRALNDAMPRHAIDAIEKQIAGLTQRIAEGRQAGIDGGALSGVEHGLAEVRDEVRDALRGLTPAENLVGFNDAVNALARKIDLIVAQKDPATLQQLEHAITTLREMAARVASDDAIGQLSGQVQMLAEKVDHLAASGGAIDALNNLEQRISALSDALEARAQSGDTVPPILDSLVHSLSDKIEMIQQSRGDNIAVGHLEDHIVKLVERLDASDSRLGHLEAIERGLADLLVHIEDMRANKDTGGLRADNSPGVDALKHDIARTQDALEQVHGTLGHVVDRLVSIERDIRGESRPRPVSDEEFAEIQQPVGRVTARVVSDAPPAQAPAPAPAPAPSAPAAPLLVTPPAPKRLPPASRLPINPDLPPDQPLEPGSGPPPLRAHAGARIAGSDARPGAASPGGKSGFIAAARRAAQAAGQAPSERAPRPESIEIEDTDAPSLRGRMMKRVKSLFIAASIIAVVVGSIQIAGNVFNFGGNDTNDIKTAKAPNRLTSEPAATDDQPAATATLAFNPLEPPKMPALAPLAPLAMPSANSMIAITPPLDLTPAPQSTPSLLSPPLLNPGNDVKHDVTGSIARPAGKGPAQPPAPPQLVKTTDQLPIAIGGPRLRNAAMAGDGAAAYEVAVRFAEGRGVPVNLEAAAHWYERAASKGIAPAQFRYASLLEKGQGVKKDLAQARRLYLAAAAKGNGKAMHNLAVLYAEGIEGKPDYATAALWFRKAALHGVADSQYNLGVLCARGLGTAKSFEESYKWFALAASQGDRESGKKREEVANQLDAGALAAAQQAVKTFAPAPQPEEATVVAEPAGGWDRAAGAPAPHGKPRVAPPMSLGALEAGKR